MNNGEAMRTSIYPPPPQMMSSYMTKYWAVCSLSTNDLQTVKGLRSQQAFFPLELWHHLK